MSLIEFDVWLPGTGLAGSPDVRLSTDDQLVDAGFNPVLWGEGDGFVEIYADHSDAQYLQRRGYVAAYNTEDDRYLFGWWLEEGDVKIVATKSNDRVIRWTGRGFLNILDRYKLGHAIYSPGQLHRGDIDIPYHWTWRDEPIGGPLLRSIEEGMFHPDEFLPVSPNFTRVLDSNGDPWAEYADYQVKIGTSVLQVAADHMRMGVVIQPHYPVASRIDAFRSLADYRTDRTSATFAAGKVRFEAGVNVAVELPQKIAALRERSHMLTRNLNGDYQTFDTGSGIPYMEYMEVPWTADPDAVDAAANTALVNLQKQSLMAVVRHKIGEALADDATPIPGNGYFPGQGGDYWLGDLVTVHTGTGEYDLNEQALEVAGIRYFLRGADWMVEAQLGAQSLKANGTPVVKPGGGTTVVSGPPIELCRPGTAPQDFAAVGLVGTAHSTSPDDVESAHFIGFWEEGLQITASDAIPVGHTLIGVVAWNRDAIGPNAGRETAMYDAAGNTWVLDTESSPVGSSDYITQIWRCVLTEQIPSGGYIRWAPKGPSVENDVDEYAAGRAMGVFEFAGQLTDPVVGATAGTFGSTHTVAAPAGDVVIGGLARHEGTVTGDGDWVAMIPWTEETSGAGVQIVGVFGQYKQNVSGENWVTTAGANKDWSARAVGYTVSTEPVDEGDGPLTGTSSRAARCDHNHYLEDLATLETDTALVPHPDGSGGIEWGVDASGGSTALIVEGVYEHNTTFSVATATDVPVDFNVDVSDVGAMHDPSSNPSRIIVQAAQENRAIRIKANITIPAVATQWQAWIQRTVAGPSSSALRRKVRMMGNASATQTISVDETFPASEHVAGDIYQVMVRQASGSSQNIGSATADARNIVEVTSG